MHHRPAPCVYRGYAQECAARGVAQASDVLSGILVLAGGVCQQNIASATLCDEHTFLIAASGGGKCGVRKLYGL